MEERINVMKLEDAAAIVGELKQRGEYLSFSIGGNDCTKHVVDGEFTAREMMAIAVFAEDDEQDARRYRRKAQQVTPVNVSSSGLAGNIFTGNKTWTVQCGECDHSWLAKTPIGFDPCSAICPCCGAQNVWSLEKFAAYVEEAIEAKRKRRESRRRKWISAAKGDESGNSND